MKKKTNENIYMYSREKMARWTVTFYFLPLFSWLCQSSVIFLMAPWRTKCADAKSYRMLVVVACQWQFQLNCIELPACSLNDEWLAIATIIFSSFFAYIWAICPTQKLYCDPPHISPLLFRTKWNIIARTMKMASLPNTKMTWWKREEKQTNRERNLERIETKRKEIVNK